MYLINYELFTNYYMGESKKEEMSHIVNADNEELAKDKLQNFYYKMDSEYDVSYWININYCNEAIL